MSLLKYHVEQGYKHFPNETFIGWSWYVDVSYVLICWMPYWWL